jgi:hypothetical protein
MRTGFVVHHDQADHPVYSPDASHGRCEAFWRGVTNYHAQKWPGSAGPTLYSFGVCRHGDVFTGRGWTTPQAAGGADQIPDDLQYRDIHWYSVLCFLGGDEQPTAEMLTGLAWLVTQGRDSGRCGLAVIPHNRFRLKPCPGPELTEWCEWADGNPDLGDDDMTPEDRRLLQDIHFAWVGARRLSGADGPETIHDLATPVLNANHWASIELPKQHAELEAAMPTALDVEQLAEAIVSRLPQQSGGTVVAGPSLEQVKQALLEVLRR